MPRDDEDDEGSDDDQGLEDDELDEDGSGKAYTMRCRMYESQFPEYVASRTTHAAPGTSSHGHLLHGLSLRSLIFHRRPSPPYPAPRPAISSRPTTRFTCRMLQPFA